MNICWFFENWAIFMNPQFQIEIIFSIIAIGNEEFPFHHQSQNIPKSIVSFEYKHTNKINLCQLLCWFWKHRLTFHNNLWSRNFYQFLSVWHRKGNLDTQHHSVKKWKKQDLNPLRLQSPCIIYYIILQDMTRHQRHLILFSLSQSVTLNIVLFLFINSPSPRILRRKLKNNYF